MAAPGVSTIGVKFGWGAAGDTKPASFTQLTRISAIGGINLETEQIDVSALEDYISKYVSGRADTGGSLPVTVLVTDDTITEWEAVITASEAAKATGGLWFTVWSPYRAKGFFFKATTPSKIPMPEYGQNAAETVEITLTISEYVGLDTKVEPTGTTGTT